MKDSSREVISHHASHHLLRSRQSFQGSPPVGTDGEGSRDPISGPSSLLAGWPTSEHHLWSLGISFFFYKIRRLY